MDCGPACLWMIASYYGKQCNYNDLLEKTGFSSSGVSLLALSQTAMQLGFKTMIANVAFDDLKKLDNLPFVCYWRKRHFVVVYKFTKKYVLVADPAYRKIKVSYDAFVEGWQNENFTTTGTVLFLEPTDVFDTLNPSLEKEKGMFGRLLTLTRYLSPYKNGIYQILFSILLVSLIQLMLPVLAQSVIDLGINQLDLHFIAVLLFGQIVLFSGKSVVDIARSWTLMQVGSKVNITLLSEFLSKMLSLPLKFYESRKIGDIMQRVRDNERIKVFLTNSLLSLVFSATVFTMFSVALIYYNLAVFIVFLVGAIAYIGWIFLFLKRRRDIDFKLFDQHASDQNKFIEIFSGIQEIKLHNMEQQKRYDWEAIQVNTFDIGLRGLSINLYQQHGALFINQITNIIITFFSAKAVISGEITLGTMFAIQYIVGQLNGPIADFIGFTHVLQDAKMSLERLNEINTEKEEVDSFREPGTLANKNSDIVFKNVHFSYNRSSSHALKNINCVIPHHKTTAIVGASGGGKSTFLKLLLQLYLPSDGKIYLGGTPLQDLGLKNWRARCGAVMQDGFIFSDTIAANISLCSRDLETLEEPIHSAIKAANLHEFVESLPLGIYTKIGMEGIGLSQGQRQRILIARVIFKNPSLIILDEATNALDTHNENSIMKNMEDFLRDKTVVVVAHRLSTIKHADQILVMKGGSIAEEGTHESLVARKGYYYQLIQNQLEMNYQQP